MQDMATMRQHSVTSPEPAPTVLQDSVPSAHTEMHQETTRTDAENRTATTDHDSLRITKDRVILRDDRVLDLKCQNNNNNNEMKESNENIVTKNAAATKRANRRDGESASDTNSDQSDSDHRDANNPSSDRDQVKMDVHDRDADSGNESEMKYVCPICDKMLSSQHEFTLHIRSHNNNESPTTATEQQLAFPAKGYSCKICSKVLSSSSSLDRHVLVHSGERPFKCRVCAVAFTTNGNMHRHMRTHSSGGANNRSNGEESDGSSDSGGSTTNQNGKSPGSPTNNNNGNAKKRRVGMANESEKTPETSPEPNNNNNNNNKRKVDEILGTESEVGRRKMKGPTNLCVTPQRFQCPVCEREDFASLNVLETHLESTHPDYKIRCRSCDLDFKNHRVLNLHRFMVHHDCETAENFTASVLGFKDLTFMDFSSDKFPQVARTVCEQTLHQAASQYHNFQCDKCGRAFPCSSALLIHHRDCYNPPQSAGEDSPTDLSRRESPGKNPRTSSDEEEEEKKRDDFFAGLDLQNKSVPTSPVTPLRRERSYEVPYYSPEGTKDLADIQSIISVTNAGGLRLQDLTKSPVVNGSLTPSDKSYSDANEEEQQDCFAAEFRRMKLKGEFPCRLCAAVFPNLRALKGHNRAHLVSGNVFRCNMCPYSNADKAILIRHMRSHNGDRPYECGLCNYAFTTKANCERHLRNRHSKLGRDEVKKSIIYHPSEDPTNDLELQAKLSAGSDNVKRSLNFNVSTEDLSQGERYDEKYQSKVSQEKPKIAFDRERFDSFVVDRRSPIVAHDRPWDTHEVATMTSPNNDDSESDSDVDNSNHDNNKLVNLTKNNNNNNNNNNLPFHLSEHQRSIMQRYSPSINNNISIINNNNNNNNAPLDLSMDALDLSKKSVPPPPPPNTKDDNSEPQDLSKKSSSSSSSTSSSSPEYNNNVKKYAPVGSAEISHLQAQLMSRPQSPPPAPQPSPTKPDVNMASFYAAHPHALYLNNNAFPFPAQPFMNPYFIPPQHPLGLLPPTNLQEYAEMRERSLKELIRGLQMSGGTMLDPISMATAAGKFQQLQQQALAELSRNKEMKYGEIKAEERPPPQKEEKVATNVGKLSMKVNANSNVAKPGRERDNSSVKMVIKNGVLMPKQKQRRYRTERPFFCEHCSARFTLRSNMERHIKQQHPEFWTQRQRGNIAGSRRGAALSTASHDSSSQHTLDSPRLDVIGIKAQSPGLPIQTHAPNTHYPHTFDAKPKTVDDCTDAKDKLTAATNNNNNNKAFISDEVKHAIAQQLKSKLGNPNVKSFQDDDDDELIIDEEEEIDDKVKVKEELKNLKNATNEHAAAKHDPNFLEGYKSFKDSFLSRIKSEIKVDGFKTLQNIDLKGYLKEAKEREMLKEMERKKGLAKDEGVDLASVSRLLDNATTQTQAFQQYFQGSQDNEEEGGGGEGSEEDEEGLVAPSDNSGSDENRSDLDSGPHKKKSAYSLAPNRVSCPYCHRKFPWSSSLRRHVLTHTGQKPYKCAHCPLLFTTKSNCDRHLLRKHAHTPPPAAAPAAAPDASPPPAAAAQAASYTMRNVPERPYKCNHCPSSTFSTLSNLKKHVATKHLANPHASRQEEAGSHDESSDEEHVENEEEHVEIVGEMAGEKVDDKVEPCRGGLDSASTTSSSASDLPFKCHLCEASYAERQDALEHIREIHPTEFSLLVAKGALDSSAQQHEDTAGVGGQEEGGAPPQGGEESLEQLRGKFPDYANRKVMCAFCLRRFWSAEDLRRHMRTHTGERPFSCDICRRRFTLKHSMLRHRKKHGANDASALSGDDEPAQPPPVALKAANENGAKHDKYYMKNATEKQEMILKGYMTSGVGKNEKIYNQFIENNMKGNVNGFGETLNGKAGLKITNHNNNNIMGPIKGMSSRYIMENPWPGPHESDVRVKYQEERKEGEEDTDLIGNLLGIQDKSIIDKMLVSKSADDAAKLLGVGNRE